MSTIDDKLDSMRAHDDNEKPLKTCWGHFEGTGPTKAWYPNLKLYVSPDEQYRQNKENGFIK